MKLKFVSDGTSVGSQLYAISEDESLHIIEGVTSINISLDIDNPLRADIELLGVPVDIEFDSTTTSIYDKLKADSEAHKVSLQPQDEEEERLLQEEEQAWMKSADEGGRRLALLELEKMQLAAEDLVAFIYSGATWRECIANGDVFPDYEMNAEKQVRRRTKGRATHLGKSIGVSKNGSLYSKLGLRKDGETTFITRNALLKETWPEMIKEQV